MRTTLSTKNHNTFGGLITEFDFCTDYPRKDRSISVADRIFSDFSFDRQCMMNAKSRDFDGGNCNGR